MPHLPEALNFHHHVSYLSYINCPYPEVEQKEKIYLQNKSSLLLFIRDQYSEEEIDYWLDLYQDLLIQLKVQHLRELGEFRENIGRIEFDKNIKPVKEMIKNQNTLTLLRIMGK